MYLPSASPMWQARRGFSGLRGLGKYKAMRRRRGLRGLGDDSLFDIPTDLPLDTSSIDTTTFETLPDPFQTLDTSSFGMPQPLAPTTTNYPTITPPAISSTSSPIASMNNLNTVLTSAAASPAQPASLLSTISAALGLTKAVTGGTTRPAAPAGYAYNSAGQLVPLSSGFASSGGSLLLLGGAVFLVAMMAGGRK